MKELVFLLEEASAGAMLESLLPRILQPGIRHRLIVFEGKQDLEKQLYRRLRAYLNPQARFIVLRDQDCAPDCTTVKAKLLDICHHAEAAGRTLVRIACKELEAFYLADLHAVEQALGITKLVSRQGNALFRSPDRLGNPSKELEKLTSGLYQKVSGSRAIGEWLDLTNERSPSFRNLVDGIRRMEAELLVLPGSSDA